MSWLKKILCAVCLLLSFGVSGSAQDTRAQEEKKARLEREIAIIDRQLAENASRSSAMLSNLTLIRKKIANREALVAESDRQIKTYSDNIYLKQRQINRLQARIDTLTNHYLSKTYLPKITNKCISLETVLQIISLRLCILITTYLLNTIMQLKTLSKTILLATI